MEATTRISECKSRRNTKTSDCSFLLFKKGIAARSGTLSYEASFATKDLGQSYIFGLGGDFYPGTRLAEVLEFFMHDKGTRGIVLVGEVGGVMEEEVADLLSSTYLNAEGMPIKPVVGFIAGRNVPPGQIFGHSGAIWRDGLSSAEQKRMIWRKSGIIVVDAIADVGEAMRDALDTRYGDFSKETPSNISSSSP
jgi:succinyl-CoA synthetase alpha subunit